MQGVIPMMETKEKPAEAKATTVVEYIVQRLADNRPASTLLGLDDDPCELTGYGPIPADLGRRIAANGTWRRLG